ncbi:MAG: DUF3426 domain-containing protein [Rhodospirillales bacterium]|nr:DUF3426 domain-containing protein [Rhodospirillales bacterium]
MVDPAVIQEQMQAMADVGQMPQSTPLQSQAQPAQQPAPAPTPAPEPIPEPEPEPEPEPKEDPPSQEELDDMFGDDAEPEPIDSLIGEGEDDEGGINIGLLVGLIFLLLVIGVLGAGYFLRDTVQELVPQSKPIYEMIGIGEPLGTGLEFQDVRSQRSTEGEVDVLNVTGTVVNISDSPRDVPMIRVSLLSGEKDEIQFLNLTPDMAQIPPGEKMDFKGVVMDPAATARRLEVTFTEPEEMPEGEAKEE